MNWNWSNAKYCDVANLILGAILFFSPWMFGFDAGKVSQNAYIAGIVIAVLAIAALAAFAVWRSGRTSAFGCWCWGRPGSLGFRGPPGPWRFTSVFASALLCWQRSEC